MSSANDKMDEVFRPYLLCGENIGRSEENFLKERFTLVKLPPFGALSDCVASHADMLFLKTPNGVLTHKKYIEENPSLAFLPKERKKALDDLQQIRESFTEELTSFPRRSRRSVTNTFSSNRATQDAACVNSPKAQ